MLYNYIKVGSDKIVKATPSGYTIKELKTSIWILNSLWDIWSSLTELFLILP